MKRVLFMYKVPGFAKASVSAKASPRQDARKDNETCLTLMSDRFLKFRAA